MFSIEKDVWDTIHLERIETSSDPAKKVKTRTKAPASRSKLRYVLFNNVSFLY